MPSYEDFESNIEAHLLYIDGLSAAEALTALKRRLADGSWRGVPGAWLHRLEVVVHRHGLASDDRVAGLRSALVSDLISGRVEREAHETLRGLFGSHTVPATVEETVRLVEWFTEKAEPGDASLAADVLEGIRRDEEHALRDAVDRLRKWLLLNGAAELRARRRAPLLLDFIKRFDRSDADPAIMAFLVRYIIVNDEDLGAHPAFLSAPHALLQAVEHSLERGGSEPLMAQLAAKMGPSFIDNVLEPPDGWPVYPVFQRALLRSLAHGSGPLPADAWRSALWCRCPESGIEFGSGGAVTAALDALRLHASLPHRRNSSGRGGTPENDRAWALLIASECARIFDITNGLPKAARQKLQACIGWLDSVTEGIAEALRDALRDRTTLAAMILAESPNHGVVAAAIVALPESPRIATEAAQEISDAELLRAFTQLLHRPWEAPVFGVDLSRAFGGATRVEFGALPDEDKILIRDGVVTMDRKPVDQMLRLLVMDRAAKLALATIYFVHELVHVVQGVGDKTRVASLRSTGAETTLMHVDLGADHVAALAVASAFPKWDVTWLKDLQGRSLVAFPVSPYNTAGGQARKAQRLIGLRLDYLARTTGDSKASLGDGYAFADYGPAGGAFLVMVSGPPVGLIGMSSLSPSDAGMFADAANAGLDAERLARIDGVLRQKLGGA